MQLTATSPTMLLGMSHLGGAMWLASPYATIQQCRFENNSAGGNSGAVYATSQILEDGTWAEDEQVAFTGCTFRNNTAVNVNGGGLYYQGSIGENYEALFLTDTVFAGNNASSGGAFSPWGAYQVQIDGCTFEQNVAYYGRGAGLYAYGKLLQGCFALPTLLTVPKCSADLHGFCLCRMRCPVC